MTYDDLVRTEILKLRTIDEQSVEGLETLRSRAQDVRLRETLAELGSRASTRARRLEGLCARRGWPEAAIPSRCLQGVQEEARESLGAAARGPVTDAVVACVALRLVHLGIASYESALALAAADPDLVRTLARSLDEERKEDVDLEWVLRSAVAPAAARAVAKGGAADEAGFELERTRR